ncbi:GNAT family N-acetyltransferase [Streptomyces sp. NPDC046716]|uniref:GNAT family N-acetyltransferase n=1 Tax=Streptomyces sp. NPDC046716 TaxID=3157093 RepID=UPI0033F8D040
MPLPPLSHVLASRLIVTRSGRATVTRPALAADLAAVNAMHGRCSSDTIYSRYQTVRSALREREWAQLTRAGHSVSWVTTAAGAPDAVVAVTHLLRGDDERCGELALLVEDDWQNAGLGTGLTRWALAQAAGLGMSTVRVLTSPSNRRMNAICRALGARPAPRGGPDTAESRGHDLLQLELPVPGASKEDGREAVAASHLASSCRTDRNGDVRGTN